MTTENKIGVGDWVRFYSGWDRKLVIGVVEYIREKEAWEKDRNLVTTEGSVREGEVLEVRSED